MVERKGIKINCSYSEIVPIEKLEEFQGELKVISPTNLRKLKQLIIRRGILFPAFVWKTGKHLYILDAHQRKKAITELKREGWEIEGMPVVYVNAKNRQEAKEALLAAESRFGKVTQKGFDLFAQDIELDGLLDLLNLPEVGNTRKSGSDAEVPFTEELHEEHNYLVLYFDNDVDWQQAKTVFGLKTVKALDSKPGFERKGIGRVIKGSEAINKLLGMGSML